MSDDTRAPQAGWYPAPHANNEQRYWDGAQWTEWTPESAQREASDAQAPADHPTAPIGQTAVLLQPPAPHATPRRPVSATNKRWLLGGAIAVGVLVVGAIGAAIGRGQADDASAQTVPVPAVTVTVTQPPVAEPPPPAAPAPSVPAAPAPVAIDPVAFRAEANSQLDDMNKDLDDLVVTVQEDGFWRLLSNSAELSFNLGQLQGLEVPATGAEAWAASLTQLDGTLDTLSEAIDSDDGPTILSAVDVVRGQVLSTRAVADAVQ